MVCPHCSTVVKFEWESSNLKEVDKVKEEAKQIFFSECPNCNKLVVLLEHGNIFDGVFSTKLNKIQSQKIIYPKTTSLQDSEDIPVEYLEDYEESIKVLAASPKASAALTRRLLQNILRNEFSISEKSLAKEIEKFISLPHIPSHITSAVDAVRQIGNIAAHPTKNLNTGEIVPVEKGEAEWLIEVIEALFDFVFIQPKKLQKRKQQLNLKLEEIGKPQMK